MGEERKEKLEQERRRLLVFYIENFRVVWLAVIENLNFLNCTSCH